MSITGGCLCGAVRYESAAAPLVTRACWCRVCQFIGAGSGTVNTCCPTCGTHLFSEAEARPHLIFVRAGSLDEPNGVEPSMTIWTSQAPLWACISQSLPRIERQPPPAA